MESNSRQRQVSQPAAITQTTTSSKNNDRENIPNVSNGAIPEKKLELNASKEHLSDQPPTSEVNRIVETSTIPSDSNGTNSKVEIQSSPPGRHIKEQQHYSIEGDKIQSKIKESPRKPASNPPISGQQLKLHDGPATNPNSILKSVRDFKWWIAASAVLALTAYTSASASWRYGPLAILPSHAILVLSILSKAGDISFGAAASSMWDRIQWGENG